MSTAPSARLLADAKALADALYRANTVGPSPSREQLGEWERIAQRIEDGLLELAQDDT